MVAPSTRGSISFDLSTTFNISDFNDILTNQQDRRRTNALDSFAMFDLSATNTLCQQSAPRAAPAWAEQMGALLSEEGEGQGGSLALMGTRLSEEGAGQEGSLALLGSVESTLCSVETTFQMIEQRKHKLTMRVLFDEMAHESACVQISDLKLRMLSYTHEIPSVRRLYEMLCKHQLPINRCQFVQLLDQWVS